MVTRMVFEHLDSDQSSGWQLPVSFKASFVRELVPEPGLLFLGQIAHKKGFIVW